jgi:hypothetical protein
MDDASYRSFDTMEDYRHWCEENLPDWLGYGREDRKKNLPDPFRTPSFFPFVFFSLFFLTPLFFPAASHRTKRFDHSLNRAAMGALVELRLTSMTYFPNHDC